MAGGHGHNKRAKELWQYTKEGEFVKKYGSGMEVRMDTGIQLATIDQNLRGDNLHAGGFIWWRRPIKEKLVKKLNEDRFINRGEDFGL
jgi:hypothetical protein